VSGVVADSVTKEPLAGAEVRLLRAGRLLASATTGIRGGFTLTILGGSADEIEARRIGFHPLSHRLAAGMCDTTVSLALGSVVLNLDTITVTAASPVGIDPKTGNTVFQQDTYHGSPPTTTSEIVQQAVAGAARAPTGEVHIRGQHGEYTYYVDGVPVPPGISGSLSELFSPAIVDRAEFETGGWDAEYGNRNTAVIKVDTRIPPGGLGLQGSLDAGAFGTSGEGLLATGNVGRFGVVLSGARRVTDMWHDPVMPGPGGEPLNFHNAGSDLYGFGKLRYTAGARDLLTLDVNLSRTSFEVPFDSTGGVRLNDHQQERNGFGTVSWRHAFGQTLSEGELFVALYHRASGLTYTPGLGEAPEFLFYPDTVRYNVSEERSGRTTGVKADALLPATGKVQFRTGVDASLVRGHEHFATEDAQGDPGPSVDSPVRGGDLGAYAEASWRPSPLWELRPGLRYDVHSAPLAGDATQLSPRFRLSLFPSPQASVWLYYGRLFVPSPVEDFHVLASAGQGGAVGLPTYPERDHFVEAGTALRLPRAGITIKLEAYHKWSTPAIDDNTLPGTALTATVNVARVRITGIESVLEIRPAGPIGGYLNVALSHAYAHGPITGGFSPTAYPSGWYDLDHDQRLSIVGNLSYTVPRWFGSITGIFGSGLTNGHPDAAPTGLGLFDFNAAVKVPPNFIVNAALGANLRLLGSALRPQVFIDNLFNLHYVLKGAFTSGPALGRPRTFSVQVSIGR